MTNINAAALYNACLAGDAAAVSRLLPAGGTPRNLSGQRFQFNNTKTTPLMAAAEGGHTEIVRMMLERARNTIVDYADAQGYTAQHMAVQYHNVDILRLLADCGANVNLATCRGDTALRLTVGRVNPDSRPRDSDPDGARQIATVKALLHIGAVPDSVDRAGTTPLCIACNFASNIDYPGFTPRMHTVGGNRAGVTKLLLKLGADGTKRTTDAAHGLTAGYTALDIARTRAGNNHACAEIFAVLRKRCCSTCGMTSPGPAAKTAGEQKHLKRCGNCPARGSRARYCNEQCQRVDWVSRHRGECAEARRARQAAGTEV